MKKRIRILTWIVLAGVAGFSITSYGATNMPDAMSSVCAGRFLVKLPENAKASIDATYHYMAAQSPIPAASFDAIKQKLEIRANKLKAENMSRDPESDKLMRRAGYDPDKIYGTTQLVGFQSDDSVKQVVIGYHLKSDSPYTTTEVYKFIAGSQYVFLSKEGRADKYPETSAAMWSAATHFQPLPDHTQPSGPGFCVYGGMFADVGHPSTKESFTLVVRFKDHPDAQFTIDANAISSPDKGEPSLKFRVDSELGILRQNVEGHVAVLVRGEHEAAGQKGYQIGLSVPNDTVPGTTAYKFFWAADGVPNDVTRPYVEVQLTIQPDEDKPATITTADAAKAMWEELLQGIQIRPGAVRH